MVAPLAAYTPRSLNATLEGPIPAPQACCTTLTELYASQGSCGETGAHPGGEVKREDAAAQNISPRGVLDKPLHSVSTMTTEEGQGRCRPYDNEELLQSGRIQSFSMEQDDHTSDEEDPSEDESCLRRSARNHGTDRLHSVSSENFPCQSRRLYRVSLMTLTVQIR